MRAYVDVTGKNEDEAISKALSQLGMERDDVSVEVLERAKSGFLGIGSCPAKVRVYYGEEEEPQPKPEPVQKPEPKPVQRPEPKPVQRPEPKPVQRPEEKTEKPIESERRPEKKQPRREPQPKPEEEVQKEPPAPVQALGDEVDDEKAQAIKKFLSGLLEQMDSVAEVKVYLPEKGRYKVILEGQGLGALIGRRGETLDAIQQLTSYAVNRTGVRVRVQLDAENYRAKREQSLYHLAHKVAAKVVRYRRSFTLEPMNAYERHVIHTALQDFEGVVTHSTGVDPNRRVVVSLDREKK
ncbi:MAG: KH domain-containing protein [Oscillibacter sp.]|jgi:spoIIIJ-associated protein|nr:KH domain-containing protein [Oscillibacter sp.]